MPFPPSSSRASSGGRKPGSKSAGHRGHRPDEAPSKNRWSADRRQSAAPRGNDADRGERGGERRPDWTPVENRPHRNGSAPRFGTRAGAPASGGSNRFSRDGDSRSNDRSSERGGDRRPSERDDRRQGGYQGDRPARSFDRSDRGNDRPARSFDRNDRGGDRPTRSFDRNDRNDRGGDRPTRSFDRDDRAPRREEPSNRFQRPDRDARPQTDRSPSDRPQGRAYSARSDVERTGGYRSNSEPRSDDRAARSYERPERSNRFDRTDRTDRPARSFDRDARPARSDDRPSRGFDRDERPARSFDRSDRPARSTERPARSFDRTERTERPARSFERTDRPERRSDDRPTRSFDRSDRPARSFDHSDRPARSNDREDRPSRFERPERSERTSDFYGPSRSEHNAASGRPDRNMSDVDDVVLERLEAQATTAEEVEGVTFGDLGLGSNIVRMLADLGASSPFPIQAATIPEVLKGRDVLGRGRTGSGKTIAFGAPLVERLMENNGGTKRALGRAPRALILAPTRELALQIDGTVQPIARSVGLFTTQVYGGVPQARQVGALRRGVDIVIGTPGRIEDLVQQGALDLSEVSIVVLDEADHMCDLGFLEPVQRILRHTADGGQRLLFSATLDSGVAKLVDEFLVDPAVHEVAGEDQASSTIDHRVLLIEQRDKIEMVAELASGAGKTLVFARTRAFAEQLSEELEDRGIPATSLHGDLNQARRTRSLERLTSGKVNVLVATDVAARGIHVDDIGLVIQADAPEEYKTYLHRAGRTGRAGKQGIVVTLIAKPRRRKMEELLSRADITAEITPATLGSDLVDSLKAR
ncbi:DEAD/DEAH box helicase [Naasia lichenicola]|uniref:DEAD/DEAH box helicase n=1 Tax=Naasia lichenicola TaxID=2565933 RepID=A0A4S4FHI6_9MICO|nr:DEAD/DEAH box helicase [Naasia lichenicola]THG29561.1 DEAD/DEAH box helicase [Naasia lichenicola]